MIHASWKYSCSGRRPSWGINTWSHVRFCSIVYLLFCWLLTGGEMHFTPRTSTESLMSSVRGWTEFTHARPRCLTLLASFRLTNSILSDSDLAVKLTINVRLWIRCEHTDVHPAHPEGVGWVRRRGSEDATRTGKTWLFCLQTDKLDLASLEWSTKPGKTVQEKWAEVWACFWPMAMHYYYYSVLPTFLCQKLKIHFMDIIFLLFLFSYPVLRSRLCRENMQKNRTEVTQKRQSSISVCSTRQRSSIQTGPKLFKNPFWRS